MANDEQEGKAMLRGFVIVTLVMFSVSVLSTSAEMWMDDFGGDKLNEKWEAVVSKTGGLPPADWKVENGVLKGHWPTWGQQHLLIEYPSSEYTVQVKCRFDKIIQKSNDNGAGIIFHSSGPDRSIPNQGAVDFYLLGLGPNPSPGGAAIWNIGRFQWGPMRTWWAPANDPIQVGEWYTLKLKVNGNSFRGYVNDALAIEVEDDKFVGAYVGPYISLYVDASFDDFMITDQQDFETLAQSDTTSVSPRGALITTWSGLKKQ
jgi:hypothetical protein